MLANFQKRCGGENDKYFIAESNSEKILKNRPTFSKVINEKCSWSFF